MTLLMDRYELGEPLGSGGMARVVAATDRRLGRRVAIKLIRDELVHDPTVRLRLEREARAAASLDHPNTVRVFDVGEHDGTPFVVMELIEGHTLADELRGGRVLAPERSVEIVAGMLAGLAAAHERSLIHRDVKPGNVLLTTSGEVKLADFGIARGLAEAATALTATGTVLGTPRYLAPELAAGATATAASDLYAVGTVLYELLSGTPPFTGESPIAVAIAHQREPVPALPDHVPEPLAAICRRALAKEPNARFASAESMRAALLDAASALMAPGDGTPGAAPPVVAGSDHRGPQGRHTPHTAPLTGSTGTRPTDGTSASHLPDEDEATFGRRPRAQLVAIAIGVVLLALAAVSLLGGPDTETAGEEDAEAAATTEPETEDPPGQASGTDDPAEGDRGPNDQETGAATPGGAGDPDDEPGDGPPGDPGQDAAPDALAELDELIERIEEDPDRFGEAAADVRDELISVRGESDLADRADDARELTVDIATWILDGELERRGAREVIDVLGPLGAPRFEQLDDTYAAFLGIADDPRRTEPHTIDLLDDLADLLEETSADVWRDDARDLLDRIDGWIDDRDVSGPSLRDVRRALERLAD